MDDPVFNKIFKYTIVDIECLYDYFSFQYKHENMKEVKIIECFSDFDCYKLYEFLKTTNDRAMYVYSLDYDSIIINALCKLVEKKETNILYKLRDISNCLFQNNINYTNLNRDFWCNCYFKIKEIYDHLDHKEISFLALAKLKKLYPDKLTLDFLNKYSFLLGKSKVFKKLIINSIPEILKYTAFNKDNVTKMTISLKKIQLINEGYNIKFDFNKYDKIKDIKADNLYNNWIKYSKNDVLSLEKIFLKQPKDDIIKRWYAYKAVKLINKNFKIDMEDIFSETNTSIINKILKIENPINDFDIDYTKYIQSTDQKFNEFVEFVNNNKELSDAKIKEQYSETYKNKHLQYFDKLDYDEISLGESISKMGFGGIHGALNNYLGENLIHLDYASQYPSIILQYKELFSNILDVDMYEAVYNLRLKMKRKRKIDEEAKLIESGLKLILSMVCGLINSNFNIAIACKNLGRFITFKGQSLIINLTHKVLKFDPNAEIIDVNTDGIIIKTTKNMDKIINEDKDGYFKLGKDIITKIIQKDVNNYIKIVDGEMKTKGCFNFSIKQHINKNEKLSVNLTNGLNLLNNKSVEVLPVYFDSKWFSVEEKAYYLTDKENGTNIIKNTKEPKVLGFKYDLFYFTENKEKAKLELYKKYAEIVKNSLLDFTFIKTKVTKNTIIDGQISMF